MATLLFTHPACLDHDTGPGHPERRARLEAVWDALDDPGFSTLDRREAPRAEIEQIARVHPRHYVEAILEASPASGYVRLDPDTVMSPGSAEAALRAAGAVCAAVDAVLGGEARNAFCAIRPCGHHAEPERPMGFCLFNNVAVGAEQARAVHGLKRIAVIDFDVHHGNGTQAMFEADPDLFFASTHQYPFYPGTGGRAERGRHGNIVNAPLSAGDGSAEFRHAMSEIVLPATDRFAPELILISAGFDAHAADPLASLELVEEDFVWATREIGKLADKHCGSRLVSTLEGGYDLGALGRSCAVHVKELMAM